MNIIGQRRFWLTVSAIMFIVSVVAISTLGFNLGVEFTGGTNISVPLRHAITAPQAEKTVNTPDMADLGLKSAEFQPFSKLDRTGHTQYGLMIKTRLINGNFLSDEAVNRIVGKLEQNYGKIDRAALQVDKVGPVIGGDLTRNAILASIIASLLMLVYIGFRFEFKSGVAAVIAMVHDVFIVLGVFSLLRQEINGTFVAAVLTIIGYSVNDTIVVFDRIRENLQFRKKGDEFEELVNDSIIQTLRRTVNTGMTALFAVTILFLFGGESLKQFTLAMIIGMVSGTYSSIFIASPIWVVWRNWTEKRATTRKHAAVAR